MTENDVPIYVCAGCQSVMPDPRRQYSNRYSNLEARPLCMTNDELYILEYGNK